MNNPWMLSAVALLLLLILIFVPPLRILRIWGEEEKKGPLELENDYRQTLIQLFGGLALVITVYSAIDSMKLAHRSFEMTAETLDLSRRGQIADRTFKAMELLSQSNPDARVAAMYALEQIANEDPASEWLVTENLFNYVRVHSHWSGKPKEAPRALPRDISAGLDVLRRRPWRSASGKCVEYRQCPDYQKGERPDPNAPDYFKEINLPEVDLRRAFLEHAMLKGAIIPDAHLEFARFSGAHCEDTFVQNSVLFDVRAIDSFWNGANLENADLRCAHFCRADMDRVYLRNAQLQGADLRNVRNLSKSQLELAKGDAATLLSDEALRPSSWSASKTTCPAETDNAVRECR